MSTVIDALVVTLGLDVKKYKEGSAEAIRSTKKTSEEAARAAKDMEARGAQAAQFFAKIRNEALALLAVFTAGVGIKQFTENTVTGAISLGYLSENLKMSTEELSAWQRAAERAGSSKESITAQLKESASESAKYKLGQHDETMGAFARNGGDMNALKDGNSFLKERMRLVSNMYKRDPAVAAEAAKQMGISEENFNLVKNGPEAWMRLVDAQRVNSGLTEEQTRILHDLNNKYLDFKDKLRLTGETILVALAPAIKELLSKLEEAAGWVANHKEDIKEWIKESVITIKDFVIWADKAAESAGGWKNVIMALIALRVGTGLIQLAATLASIGSSLGLIGGGGAALGVLAKVGVGVGGALAYDLLNPKEAGAGEEEELKNYYAQKNRYRGDNPAATPEGSAARGQQIVANALGDLLFKAEGSYDSVNRGEKGGNKSGKEDLQNMTVRDVMKRQQKGDFNAVGKYQYIKGTLAEAVKFLGIDVTKKFDAEMQDRIFREYILAHKRKALGDYISGKSSDRHAAHKDAAKEWAGLADPDTGKSYYAGVGNNKASISAERVERALLADRAAGPRNYLQQSGNGVPSGKVSNSTVSANFTGPININTQATDTKGIAKDFTAQVSQQIAAQANMGMD